MNKKVFIIFVVLFVGLVSLGFWFKTAFFTDTEAVLNNTETIEETYQTDIYKLANFSNRYPHGALGDDLEPTAVVRIKSDGSQETLIQLPEDQVFETNRIILSDITADDIPEILLTVSQLDQGSATVAYSLDGTEIARTDYIGSRFRWRHLIGVIHDEANTPYVVDVVTPHLDAILTIYMLQDNALIPIYAQPGFPSHTFGSKDLSQASIENQNGQDLLFIPNLNGEITQMKWENGQLEMVEALKPKTFEGLSPQLVTLITQGSEAVDTQLYSVEITDTDQVNVVIRVNSEATIGQAKNLIVQTGGQVNTSLQTYIVATVPIDSLETLGASETIANISLPQRAMPQ